MAPEVIGIVGLGFLGRGIAASLLGAGLKVIAVDNCTETGKTARAVIHQAIEEMRLHEAVSELTVAGWQERFFFSSSIGSLAGCDFVIESVVENANEKQQVFESIEDVIGPDVPLASNTSALSITALQRQLRFSSRLLGMHWAEPAFATAFLEIIRGEQTSQEALDAAMALGRRLGKDPCILSQDIPGFIANRLAYALYREAAHLVELGVGDVETIDRAFRNACGLWATAFGPFRWIDITGGPELYENAMRDVLPTLSASPKIPELFAERAKAQAQEKPAGQRFYDYKAGEVEFWHELLHEHAWEVRRLQRRYRTKVNKFKGK